MFSESFFIGVACGIAAGNPGCADGAPHLFKKYPFKNTLLLHPQQWPVLDKYHTVTELCSRLAQQTAKYTQEKKFFTVIGGDHSCAIGTWSGVAHALRKEGELGLIWVDAHLDAHTPQTSPSGNIHGMPVAALLGYGDSALTTIEDSLPKIKPENLCMIGIRSYESAEHALIRQHNIHVFYMEDVIKQGLDAVWAQAREIVTRHTIGYGLSVDVDSLDPQEAPGVGTPEKNGLSSAALCAALKKYCLPDKENKKLLGWEITEFNPHLDSDYKTEKLIVRLLEEMVP